MPPRRRSPRVRPRPARFRPQDKNPLDDIPHNNYSPRMSRRLRHELQQTKPFESLEEEAWLEIQRTASVTGRWVVEALRPAGVTPSQFNVLRILRGARPEA